jgi:hypothetical protein
MLRKKIAAFVAIPTLALSLAACGDSKPPKAEVAKGMVKLFEKSAGSTKASKKFMKKYADCITDKIYDKVSAKSLKNIAEGKDAVRSGNDYNTVNSAGKECAKVIQKDIQGGQGGNGITK